MKSIVIIVILLPLITIGQRNYTTEKIWDSGVVTGSSPLNFFSIGQTYYINPWQDQHITLGSLFDNSLKNAWSCSILQIRGTWGARNVRFGLEMTGATYSQFSNFNMLITTSRMNEEVGSEAIQTRLHTFSFGRMGPVIQLFRLTPKTGLKSGMNIFPYPGLSLFAYIDFYQYNKMKIPFAYFTENANREIEESNANSDFSFHKFFGTYGVELSLDVGKLIQIPIGLEWNSFRNDFTSKINGTGRLSTIEIEKKTIRPTASTQLKFGIRVQLGVAFPENTSYNKKVYHPDLQLISIIINEGRSNTITPEGSNVVDLILINRSDRGTANIQSIKVASQSSTELTITEVSPLTQLKIAPQQTYRYRIRIKASNASTGLYKFQLNLDEPYTKPEFPFEIRVEHDSSFIGKVLNDENLNKYVPSMYELSSQIAHEISNFCFSDSENAAIFWMGKAKLGEYCTKAIVNVAQRMITGVKDNTQPILDFLDPRYIITGSVEVREDENHFRNLESVVKIYDRYAGSDPVEIIQKGIRIDPQEEYYLDLLEDMGRGD